MHVHSMETAPSTHASPNRRESYLFSVARCALTSPAMYSSSTTERPSPIDHACVPETRRSTCVGTPFTYAATSTLQPSSSSLAPSADESGIPTAFCRSSHPNSPMESEVALAGSTTVCLATVPPAIQNGSMKSALAPPVATIDAVAGTTAENHAAVKAPPISVPVLIPAAGTSTSSVPASERLMRVRAPGGLAGEAVDRRSTAWRSRDSASCSRAEASRASARADRYSSSSSLPPVRPPSCGSRSQATITEKRRDTGKGATGLTAR
mmetsp:Transcript_24441/g.49602  ORF Transcript_24441/g.49602 Transcript_24441/m.49602 type:complete len:266 (+) Transcript_24441:58-855(+)